MYWSNYNEIKDSIDTIENTICTYLNCKSWILEKPAGTSNGCNLKYDYNEPAWIIEDIDLALENNIPITLSPLKDRDEKATYYLMEKSTADLEDPSNGTNFEKTMIIEEGHIDKITID